MCAKYNYYDTIIAVPSPPTVNIDPFNRLETDGQPLILICSAIPEGTRGTPVLTWTKENVGLSSDVTSPPPLLSFPSLRTSHAGRYICTARLSIPEAGVDISRNSTTNISIQCIVLYLLDALISCCYPARIYPARMRKG